jgi:hypothetical protein
LLLRASVSLISEIKPFPGKGKQPSLVDGGRGFVGKFDGFGGPASIFVNLIQLRPRSRFPRGPSILL